MYSCELNTYYEGYAIVGFPTYAPQLFFLAFIPTFGNLVANAFNICSANGTIDNLLAIRAVALVLPSTQNKEPRQRITLPDGPIVFYFSPSHPFLHNICALGQFKKNVWYAITKRENVLDGGSIGRENSNSSL